MQRGRRQVPTRRPSFLSPSPSPPPADASVEKEFTEDNRHFSMLRQLQLADWITMMNCWCGFYSIISSARFIHSNYSNMKYAYRAMLFTFAGFFFDVFDGRVARWQGKSSVMGKDLDSLADIISFGVAPATIGFSLGLQSTLDLGFLGFFVICGLLRLARFNVTAVILSKGQSKVSHFEGLPIPTSLGLVFLMFFVTYQGKVMDRLPGGLILEGTFFELHPFVFVFVALGTAYVSKSLKIPKL